MAKRALEVFEDLVTEDRKRYQEEKAAGGASQEARRKLNLDKRILDNLEALMEEKGW